MGTRKRATRKAEPSGESSLAEQVEHKDRESEPEIEEVVGPDKDSITTDRLIPSGSTMLNCACSDNPDGAFVMGSINTIPGESGSGKTILMLTMLAECATNPRFDDYDLIYDDAEEALQGFDIPELFRPLVDRLVAPMYDKDGKPIYSNTIQDLKANVLLKCRGDKPFIYVLDSFDSLSSSEEMEREYKEALKYAKSPEEKKQAEGSYKAEKAKGIGEALRMINGQIKRSDSAFFMIQQTRQKFNAMPFAQQWTTSGGKAPYFYSFHCVYMAPKGSHTDTKRGIKNKIGGKTKIKVMKNKLTGKKRDAEIDIYESYGIDDLTGCIDFLIETKEWKKSGAWITHPFVDDKKITKSDLIEYIERNDLEPKIRRTVREVWLDIEDQMKLKRKSKY